MNKVLFFAHLRDAVGEDFLRLDAAGKTVAELKAELSSKYELPKLETVMTAVNEEFAQDDEVIQEGDEVAFIPPVSGG
jgi:sulfur-carrier protein